MLLFAGRRDELFEGVDPVEGPRSPRQLPLDLLQVAPAGIPEVKNIEGTPLEKSGSAD